MKHPSPPRTTLVLLQALAGLLLIAIAALTQGTPSLTTCLGMGAWLTFLSLAGSLGRRRATRSARILGLLGVAAMLLLLVLAKQSNQSMEREPLQWGWIALVGLPLSFAVVASLFRYQMTPEIQGAWLGSVVLGLWLTEPWQSLPGLALVGGLAWAGLSLYVLQQVERVRGASPTHPLLLPGGPADGKILASVALLTLVCVLITTAGSYATATLPSLWQRKQTAEVTPVPTTLQSPVQQLGLSPRAVPVHKVIATCRARRGDGTAVAGALLLRQRYLDEVAQVEGVAFLKAREGPIRHVDDETDGEPDRRINVASIFAGNTKPLPPHHPHREAELLHQEITILDKSLLDTGSLAHPQILFFEGEAVTVGRDGAILRADQDAASYRVFSHSVSYFAKDIRREWAVLSSDNRFIPKAFDQRTALQRRVDRLLAGQDNDLRRASMLARHIASRGTLNAAGVWDGDYLALLDGEVAGDSIHYSQLFAMMARLAGLPARVAVGYRVSEWNAEQQCFLIRDTNAWMWGEVQFERLGWVMFDPTPEHHPATSKDEPTPDETSDAMAAATEPDLPSPVSDRESLSDLEQTPAQQDGSLETVLLALLILATVGLAAFQVRRSERSAAPESRTPPPSRTAKRAWRYWQKFLDVCDRQGLSKADSWTALEFVGEVAPLVPQQAEQIQELARVYYACRFGGEALPKSKEREITDCLRSLPQSLRDAVKRRRTATSPHTD